MEERKLTEEELEKSFAEAEGLLTGAILGENDRLEDVRKDLKLITELEGYPFQISWQSSVYSLVNSDVTVHNETLSEGEIVALTARFRYEDWIREMELYVQVNPVVYTPEEGLRAQIEELLWERE